MATEEEIAKALALLEGPNADSDDSPAIVVLPPDSNAFVVGNRGGFVNLAVASLKAAQGKEQSFKKESWIAEDDLDWGIKGFKPDANAHTRLAELTRPQRLGNLIGCSVLVVVALFFIVGLIAVIRWIGHST